MLGRAWISWKEGDEDSGSGLKEPGEKAGLLEDLVLSCSLDRSVSWAGTGLLSYVLVLAYQHFKTGSPLYMRFHAAQGRAHSYVLPGGI